MEKLSSHSVQLSIARNSNKKQKHRRKFALLISCFIIYPVFYRCCGNWTREPTTSRTPLCLQPQPAGHSSNLSKFIDAPNFWNQAAGRLAGAVRIPTVSFILRGDVTEEEKWKPFTELHAYLKDTFPLTHSTLDLDIIGGYSLVYTWKGSSTATKPLMLTAHMDVVPALTALDRWTYPPFSGTVDEDWVYGRGAADCKNNLIGVMTSIEHLIASKWTPHRTIVLAFGQDEEIGGPRGARNIAKHLENIYGKEGIELIVDEGGMGINTLYGTEFALPGIAEKGYLNVVVNVDMIGGHSSVPTAHTSIGILSNVVSAVEDSTVFRPRINTQSPMWGYLSCLAEHGDEKKVPTWIKEGVRSTNPNMDSIAEKFARMSPANRYLVQTSKAATIFNAGLKSNALAENARVLFNSRIDIFSSPSEVQGTFRELIKPIAEKYSLLFQGDSVSSAPSIGNITIEWQAAHNASPISPFNIQSPAWAIFSKAVQASFGQNVITAPSAMTGNTDTRYYWNLSKNIYRWSPARVGTRLNIHTVDEKIKIQTHIEGISFYTELILQSDAMANVNYE